MTRGEPDRGTAAALTHAPPRVDGGWVVGPARPRVEAGSVHVWRADLGTVAGGVLDLLAPDERERAARFASRLRGRRWARARGVLRALLASYLNIEPAEVDFRLGAHGKPALQMRGLPSALSFNMSHSGPLALYAFTAGAPIGVDVQSARSRPIDELAIAGRALGTHEVCRLAKLEPAERGDEFLRAWTRHEAARKWAGTGTWARPGVRGEQGQTGELSVLGLDVGSGAAGAVAVQHEPLKLRCWSWSGASGDACDASAV